MPIPGSVRKYRGWAGSGSNLLPQLRHELAEVVRLVHVARAPDLLEQLALADEPVGIPHEDLDEMPLRRRQGDLGCRRPSWRASWRGRCGSRASRRSGSFPSPGFATQDRAQPRQELAHAERLRDVVVGTGVERHDLPGSWCRAESTMIGIDVQPAARARPRCRRCRAGPDRRSRRRTSWSRRVRARPHRCRRGRPRTRGRRGARRAHAAGTVRRQRSGLDRGGRPPPELPALWRSRPGWSTAFQRDMSRYPLRIRTSITPTQLDPVPADHLVKIAVS